MRPNQSKDFSRNNFNNSRTIQYLDNTKKITGGDTGSSNFEESKANFVESDLDVDSIGKHFKSEIFFNLL